MPISGSAPNKTFSRQVSIYTGSDAWAQLDAAGVPVRSADQDDEANDHAAAINACLFRNGDNFNADIPTSGNKFTGVGNAAARDQFSSAAQIQDASLLYAATSSNDTITASLTPAITAYAIGSLFVAKIGGTNTGAATINYNTVGAKSIKKGRAGTLAMDAGDLPAGKIALFVYDGTNIQMVNAPEFPSGTVMLFKQTSAPTGWTKDTSNNNNSAVRIVTGTPSTGGTVDFTTAFASQTPSGTVGDTTLTTNQIPSHAHNFVGYLNLSAGGGSNHNYFVLGEGSTANGGSGPGTAVQNAGGGASHTHTFTGNSINLAVKYTDVIQATKD